MSGPGRGVMVGAKWDAGEWWVTLSVGDSYAWMHPAQAVLVAEQIVMVVRRIGLPNHSQIVLKDAPEYGPFIAKQEAAA